MSWQGLVDSNVKAQQPVHRVLCEKCFFSWARAQPKARRRRWLSRLRKTRAVSQMACCRPEDRPAHCLSNDDYLPHRKRENWGSGKDVIPSLLLSTGSTFTLKSRLCGTHLFFHGTCLWFFFANVGATRYPAQDKHSHTTKTRHRADNTQRKKKDQKDGRLHFDLHTPHPSAHTFTHARPHALHHAFLFPPLHFMCLPLFGVPPSSSPPTCTLNVLHRETFAGFRW